MPMIERYTDTLDKRELQALIAPQQPPCLSVFMSTVRAGDGIQQNPIRFKNLITQAREKLRALDWSADEIEAFLQPALDLETQEQFWQVRGDGLALFRSADFFVHYRLATPVNDAVSLDHTFEIVPLLPLVNSDGKFYVLAISQNARRLLECTRCEVKEVELPTAPQNLEEAIRLDTPDRHVQVRTGGTAKGAGVYYGQGGGGEQVIEKQQLQRYIQQVDRVVSDLLDKDNPPLVLAGVEYVCALYRENSHHKPIVPEIINGNPELLPNEALHEQAWQIVAPLFETAVHDAQERFAVLDGRGDQRAVKDIEQIAPAAYYKRVDTLFIPEQTQIWGEFDAENGTVTLAANDMALSRNLINFAAVHTLENGGSVYVLPKGETLKAILRY